MLRGIYVLKFIETKNRRKKVFNSWLLSYIFLLILTLLLNVFAYTKSISIIEDEVTKVHTASLKQLQQIMDSRLNDVKRLSIEIGFNDKINSIMRYKEPLDCYYTYSLVPIIKDLKAFKLANSFIDDLYIYFGYNNFILSYSGKYTPEEFYKFRCNYKNLSYEQWLAKLMSRQDNNYILMGDGVDENSSENNLAFIKSLPIEDNSICEATIVAVINQDIFSGALQEIKWMDQSMVMVIDQYDNILISANNLKSNSSLFKYGQLKEYEGIFHMKIDSQPVVVSYITSSVTGWKYVSIFPTGIFLEKAKYIKKIIWLSIILCLSVGFWVAFMFSKKNYTPINRMVKIINDNVGEPISEDSDEIRYIEKSLLQVIEEREKVYRKLDKQKDVLKNNFLCRLLKGHISNIDAIQQSCQNYDIHFEGDYFIAMVFYIEDYSSIFFEKMNDNGDELLNMAHFIIQNITYELIGGFFKCYVVEIDNMLCCLINDYEGKGEIINDKIYPAAEQIKKFIEDKFGIVTSIAISNIERGIEGIAKVYVQALEVLEYKMIMGKGQILIYKHVIKQDKAYIKNRYSLSEQEKFVNSIKVGNFKDAQVILNDMFDDIFSGEVWSIQLLKCRLFGILNTIICTMEETKINWDQDFWEQLNPVEKLLNCKNIAQLKEQMAYVFGCMNEYVTKQSAKQNADLVNKVKKFVGDHYYDVNLNVSYIADSFEVNPSYLSTLFKKDTGVGLLDYIHKLRIENAKKLLDQSSMNIKDVAERVGYYNSVAFIRAFKRYEGITPGKYKTI